MASDLIRKRIKYAGDVHKELLKAGWSLEMATYFVNNIPDAGADAVEVVRCKDCKKRNTEDCGMQYECGCGGQWHWETDNSYCSWGEKMDGEKE